MGSAYSRRLVATSGQWLSGRGAASGPASLPSESSAQCRAGWTRHILAGLNSHRPALAQRARDAIPPKLLQQVEESIAIRWLPFEAHMSVLMALRATLGSDAYRQLCRTQILASLRHPALFAKPARTALQLYGAGPFALFRAVPVSLRYIFRDAGELHIQLTPDGRELRARYQDFPPCFSQDDTWSLIWMATIEALAAYALEGQALRAEVALIEHEPEHGHFEWQASVVPE
ncbi:MAG: hypothetical protein RL033_365 [Pseudomonadota bacterium]